MNWLVYHIISGHAFFTGTILMIVAALASTCSQPVFRRVTVLAFLIGVMAVAVSSTAIPYWFYGVAVIVTLVWLASRYRKTWRHRAAYSMVTVWLIGALIEIPCHITPSLHPTALRTITVIGDSVTAGVGGDDKSETWPSILAREHQLQIQDISHVGETAASALRRTRSHTITAPVIIVEIGGNDILGSTTSGQFASDLGALLAHLSAPDRQIVMFELPLPPFCHEYGRAQRAIAAKHNIVLVPKRVFLSVIAGSDSTLDTIHLSQAGHEFMADCVWRLVKAAFDPGNAGQQ